MSEIKQNRKASGLHDKHFTLHPAIIEKMKELELTINLVGFMTKPKKSQIQDHLISILKSLIRQ